MQSVMAHSFSQVPQVNTQRSTFYRNHGYKTAFDSGYLIPVFVDEALPGDTFQINMTILARLSTPLRPFMDNVRLDSFFFAVPYRLVWDNFVKLMGERKNPDDSIEYIIPQMVAPEGGYAIGSIHDYFGLPVLKDGVEHSALWHRAYNLIWNEWFRDQNLQNQIPVPTDDGDDDPTDYVLKKRNKRHDYFTSCLPWPQKGDPVLLPLGTTAPVKGDGTATMLLGSLTSDAPSGDERSFFAGSGFNAQYSAGTSTGNAFGFSTNPAKTGLVADLTQATSATINELREAFQIQKLLEKDARGGTRYTEIVRSHFNVTSPDARLQRPEYLGGGSSPLNINPIAQNSAPQEGAPLAQLAATGTLSATGHGFVKSFTEHTLVIGLVCVTADLTYQNGLDKMWFRKSRYEFFWPTLAHIGEQPVLKKEIFYAGTSADEEVFGYQEKDAEYRYKNSKITGIMRSDAPQSLDSWHLSQDFATCPVLNSSFIEENPPIARVVAVQDEPQFIFDSYFNFKCTRPMPLYSVPGMIDHF